MLSESIVREEHWNFRSLEITKELHGASNLGLHQIKRSTGKIMFYQIYSLLTISYSLEWPQP